MPPPRLVRCSSRSEFRSVSVCAGKGATVSAGCGVGVAAAKAGVAVLVATPGGGEKVAGGAPVAGAGFGRV